MFTCTKPITGHIEGLHLHLEGVDGQILGHIESLLLTAHVRVAQGAPQVVQASVTGRDRFCHREGNKIDQKGLFNQKESEHDTANMRMEKTSLCNCKADYSCSKCSTNTESDRSSLEFRQNSQVYLYQAFNLRLFQGDITTNDNIYLRPGNPVQRIQDKLL